MRCRGIGSPGTELRPKESQNKSIRQKKCIKSITFSLKDSERWAPPECDYRNNCLMLLFWLILKSSLSVSIDYFGSLAIHISHKNLFAEWLRRQVPNWPTQSPCCGQASFSCWNIWAGSVLSQSPIKSGIKPKNPSSQIFFFSCNH